LKNEIEMAGVDAEIMIPEFAGVSWKGTKFTQEVYFPTWVLDTDHVLVKSALDATTSVFGMPSAIGTWSFSTNGVVTAGHFGIPTIGFAPGKEELSHSSKEELELDDLLAATKFYASFPFYLSEKCR
jgi:acetylornithine deacetylase/succinyl-diaminopimelate desuccinylase-like protein